MTFVSRKFVPTLVLVLVFALVSYRSDVRLSISHWSPNDGGRSWISAVLEFHVWRCHHLIVDIPNTSPSLFRTGGGGGSSSGSLGKNNVPTGD